MESVKKTIIITGTSSGLGLELSKQFLEKNYSVVGISRKKGSIKHKNFFHIKCDLTKEKEILNTVKIIKKNYSDFDCLICSAGILDLKEFNEINKKDLEKTYNLNIFSNMILISNLFKLIEKNNSDIFGIVSSCIFNSYPKHSIYASSKSAFEKFLIDLQSELKKTKSRVNIIYPGGFKSNMLKNTLKKLDQEKTFEKSIEIKNIAELVIYLYELPKNIEISKITINRKIN
jgi:NADP-dependent 3-hydroxy acid dehydrogenase YdfG